MFKKVWFAFLLGILSVGFSGCFDITEKFHIRKDGSGSAVFIYDLSRMKEIISTLGGGEEGSSSENKEWDEMFEGSDIMESLKRIPGISQVENLSDPDRSILSYEFEFADLGALSEALSQKGEESEGSQLNPMNSLAGQNFVGLKGNKFTRTSALDKIYEELSPEDKAQMESMGQMIFGESNYTIEYTFDQKVKGVSIKEAEISSDKHSVSIVRNMGDLMLGKATLSHTIKLK